MNLPQRMPVLECDRIRQERYGDGLTIDEALERRVLWALIEHLKQLWPLVGASDGGEWLESSDPAAVLSFVFERDGPVTIRFRSGLKSERGVSVIPGNGEDIVHDYHTGAFGDAVESFDPAGVIWPTE